MLLRLDDDDLTVPDTLSLPFPGPWSIEIGPRVPLSQIYNTAFQQSPGAAYYGFIADDVVPETPQWDQILIEIAGNDGMAVPAGGHDPEGAPHFVLGGDLVREIGFLSLPGLDRIFIDQVWLDIAKSRGVLRRVPYVLLKHQHFSKGAPYDKTYRKYRKAEDRQVYENWRFGGY